jgi:DNA-binding NarL/FixJ family response regulator
MNLQKMSLPPQQKKIIGMLADGWMPVQIAKTLNLKGSTVSTHITRLKKRLGARSTIHAAVMWVRGRG